MASIGGAETRARRSVCTGCCSCWGRRKPDPENLRKTNGVAGKSELVEGRVSRYAPIDPKVAITRAGIADSPSRGVKKELRAPAQQPCLLERGEWAARSTRPEKE
ncbi:hypothetical protein IscW_ISCW009177 [Ixodes scapularis]|uniref:Uncharacterized protein n=1 Tax=Ixodes scapularis TaxID=6945 RepID=B7Q3M2_IXOSC|nr:hypothetical protein IscW_ISCW009177 [Ixodes scapularis]|eukprot:XP_002411320.1 hypothetical protein IscW_ISCW009177 [Ixodes scapularis]